MKESELEQATIVFNKHNNKKQNAPEYTTNESDTVSIHNDEDAKKSIRETVAKHSGINVTVEIVPVKKEVDVPGSRQRKENGNEPVPENTAQEITDDNPIAATPTDKGKSKKKKTPKVKTPKIDLSFVSTRKQKVFVDTSIPVVHFKDMPVLIKQEYADVANYMVVTGDACKKDVGEAMKALRRGRTTNPVVDNYVVVNVNASEYTGNINDEETRPVRKGISTRWANVTRNRINVNND